MMHWNTYSISYCVKPESYRILSSDIMYHCNGYECDNYENRYIGDDVPVALSDNPPEILEVAVAFRPHSLLPIPIRFISVPTG